VAAKTRLLALTVAALGAAALLAACASRSEAPVGIYGNPPPVEQYLDALLPGFAVEQELDQLDPDLYASIVRRFRQGGLEALPDDDRSRLLHVAQVAFLSHAETARYGVSSRDASPVDDPSHDGEATIEETYVRASYAPWESTVSHLTARRVSMDRVCWSLGLWPWWDAKCQGELRLLVDFVSPEQQSDIDTAIVTQWGNIDGEWMCYRNAPTSSYRYYAAELDRWGMFVRIAKWGTLVGRDELDGEPAYTFEDPQDRSVHYWLDADSLWLRQFEFEDDGIRYTVKLEAVNEDITIEPPDVDVECAEEQPE
jgi:hypothetical protein